MPANMDHHRAPLTGKTVLHNGVHIQSVRHSNTSDVSTGSMPSFLGPPRHQVVWREPKYNLTDGTKTFREDGNEERYAPEGSAPCSSQHRLRW